VKIPPGIEHLENFSKKFSVFSKTFRIKPKVFFGF